MSELIAEDSTGEIHIVDADASTDRQEELPGESSDVIVSECTRDLLKSFEQTKKIDKENIDEVDNKCSSCVRAVEKATNN